MLFIIAVVSILYLFSIFMLYRSEWILEKSTDFFGTDFNDSCSYWSYEDMLWHFWIWDIEKMRYKSH